VEDRPVAVRRRRVYSNPRGLGVGEVSPQLFFPRTSLNRASGSQQLSETAQRRASGSYRFDAAPRANHESEYEGWERRSGDQPNCGSIFL
jgi:hypothetical protein